MRIKRIQWVILLASTGLFSQKSEVKTIGAMRDVMWKGELQGNILLDTIQNREGLYGIGPSEYLSGELLILDGKFYESRVVSDTEMEVKEIINAKAPFFVYSNVSEWEVITLSDSVTDLSQLKTFLDKIAASGKTPFTFKLRGNVKKAIIHIVNLPKESMVSSPEDAHTGQQNYEIAGEVEIIGYYSTQHKGVFTHHDTNIHAHLITEDRKQMGHLDEVIFHGDIQLFMPK